MVTKDFLKKALVILCLSIFYIDSSQSKEAELFNPQCVEPYNAVFSSNLL
jgi:hypothetical protein